jgi:hypothetical protein
MPTHDLNALDGGLKSISERAIELLRISHMPGYTTPTEFQLVFAAIEAIAAQMNALVAVSKEIVSQAK